MFECPQCGAPLKSCNTLHGIFWRCLGCGGRSSTTSQLRKMASPESVYALWQEARKPDKPRLRKCPACGQRMAEAKAPGAGGPVLDVCTTCQFIWFDPGELAALPARREAPDQIPAKRSPVLSEKIALLRMEAIRHRAEAGEGDHPPDEWWKWLPGIFGMPVEMEAQPLSCVPWLTWLTGALMVLATAYSFLAPGEPVKDFGLIPADYGRLNGLTFLTSFFLHGGIFHLVANLYYLLVFGDNVEDRLGRWFWLLLIGTAALAGDVAHILVNPSSTVPMVGASGGISGLLVYYTLSYPRARLGLVLGAYSFFRWIRFPAYTMILVWLGLQILGVHQQLAGFSNVSALAHLGGAAVGFLFWLAGRLLKRETDRQEGYLK